MEIEIVWLLALPVVFALGWAAARYDRGQQKRESRHVSKDILSSMSALLADDPQSATDALLSAARSAPDATELHQVVGNLYRKRGLVDRAIEVHEAALRHPGLQMQDRASLMLDLGRDYLAAGLFDRAEDVLVDFLVHATPARHIVDPRQDYSDVNPNSGINLGANPDKKSDTKSETHLSKDPDSALAHPSETDADISGENSAKTHAANQARALLLEIAQRTRDWARAIDWANELHRHGGTFHAHRVEQLMGHFYCELAVAALGRKDQAAALAALAQAEVFAEKFIAPPGVAGPRARIAAIRAHMVAGSPAEDTQHAAVGRLFACRSCGFRTRHVVWQCPGCHHWDSFGAAE